MTNTVGNKDHLFSIDILRTFAIIAVLLQHSATAYIDIVGDSYHYANIIRGGTRCSTLLFVMITGYLFLKREIQIKTMWKKYIHNLFFHFLFWSGVYSIYNLVFNVINDTYSVSQLIRNFIGEYIAGGTRVLWYIIMLMVIYAFIPYISKITNHSTSHELIALLVIMGCLSSLFPTLAYILPQFNTIFGLNIQRMQLVFNSVYVFYLLFGFVFVSYLIKYTPSITYRLLIYVLGLLGIIISMYLHSKQDETIDVYLAINIPASAMIVLFAFDLYKWIGNRTLIKRFFYCTAKNTFGIFLIHTLYNLLLQKCGFAAIVFKLPALLGIVVYSIVLFIMSFFSVDVFRKQKILIKIV